jgi:polynucleotide 5'-kinase involved in rRNA processing
MTEISGYKGPVKLEKKIDVHDEVIDGLKSLYQDVMIPLEKLASFEQFHSPPMKLTDFDANPMVLLLGQYSVGKTSFIEYLLGRAYPGQMIGLDL